MKSNITEPVDIVVPWVDGSDRKWCDQKKEYATREGIKTTIDDSDIRFRDWDIIRFLFRSIEKNMPWINMVHFITWGHLPEWMNPCCEKLHIVNHKEYIPDKYLPTFSSHTIELNIHRIPGLAEHFIYFNDDIVILQRTEVSDFFRNSLPCDYGILIPLMSSHRFSVQDTGLTNVEIINDNFVKSSVFKKNPLKWFNLRYGKWNLNTAFMMPYSRFSNFYGNHVCNSYNKKTFIEVWEKEEVVLDNTCLHKFRTRRDVNQWLMREWQLVSGAFYPISPKRGQYYVITNNNEKMLKDIREKKYKIVCINDTCKETIQNFEQCREELLNILTYVFPNKSSFEK